MGPSASQYPNTQPRNISCFADRRATPGSVVGELGGEYDRRASQRLVILPLLRALGIAFCGVAEQGGSSPQPTAQRRLDLFPRLAGQGFGVGRSQSLIDKRSFGRRHGEVVGVDRRPELIDQLNPLGDIELPRPWRGEPDRAWTHQTYGHRQQPPAGRRETRKHKAPPRERDGARVLPSSWRELWVERA